MQIERGKPLGLSAREVLEAQIIQAIGDIDLVLSAWTKAGHEPDNWQFAQITTAIDEYARGRYTSASSVVAVTLDQPGGSEAYKKYLPKGKGLAELKKAWKVAGGSR